MNDKHLETIERSIADNESNNQPLIYSFECADVIAYDIEHEAKMLLCKRLGKIKNEKKAGSI